MKETNSRPATTGAGWLGLIIPAGALAIGGVWLGGQLTAPPVLRADTTGSTDSDGDGLGDKVELVRWLDPFAADSDGDGWSDLEELARQTDALDISSFPEPAPEGLDVGLAAFTETDSLHVLTAIYAENGDLSNLDFRNGISLAGSVIEIPHSITLAKAVISIVPAKQPGDIVVLIDSCYDPGLVGAFGSMGIYTTIGHLGQDPITADTLNLVASGGALLEATAPPMTQTSGAPGGGAAGVSSRDSSSSPGSGSSPTQGNVYRPLGGGEEIPSSWEPGEICFQATSPVSASGGLVQHVVTEAACEAADAFCVPGCANLAGTTIDFLDPLALIGG